MKIILYVTAIGHKAAWNMLQYSMLVAVSDHAEGYFIYYSTSTALLWMHAC